MLDFTLSHFVVEVAEGLGDCSHLECLKYSWFSGGVSLKGKSVEIMFWKGHISPKAVWHGGPFKSRFRL